MDEVMCNGIMICERLENGILGGPHSTSFDITLDSISFTISIEQLGFRQIKISSSVCIPLNAYLTLFNSVDMLLMLMDGEFIPIISGKLILGTEEQESDAIKDWMQYRVNLFRSADFTRGSHSKFLDFDSVLTADVFDSWLDIYKELDILHQMVLYSMADTGLPIDCKCAFLIESFEALAELVESKNQNYVLPTVKKGESKLGKRLASIIELYGTDIFARESAVSRDNLVMILVNSRNRIAHIKSKQGKNFINGAESVLYAVKLSYLYRTVLLNLLGIDYSLFSSKLKESVRGWNTWNGILDSFLKKLA